MAGKDSSVGASGVAKENVVVERGRDTLPPIGGKKGGRGQSKSRDTIVSLDERTCVLEETMGDVKDCLGYVEQNLQTLEDHVLEELESLKKAVMGQDELRTRFMELFANLQEQLDVVKVGMEETRQETAMCKRAIAGGAVVTHSPRVDAPKPKEFGGKRDAKELDNFIWHMERYFEGASITDEKAKGYSAKAAPLTDLLKKGKAWEWSKRCQTAFEGLKEAVMQEPVLALPDHTKVFELQTDASDFVIRGLLMQEGHPIAFESRKLNDTEWSANQTDWARLLDVAQFSYNLMRSEATNQSPFEIAIGQQPLTPLTLAGDYKGRSPLAAQVARSWNEQADVGRSYLDKAGAR
ncbi:hypothetical protein RJ639_000120 [Escallonia herrerae]|uniref:Reverse transcriptase/retrotransposon-derived protein RNase H-like domain-containing protein n=1 Tax=Escallonia herrerae TaxID=1293975 RepID=A0AA88XC81_9ASTE|nr:hypothetical protein RJ639_000120 [Escallonia herrerae]